MRSTGFLFGALLLAVSASLGQSRDCPVLSITVPPGLMSIDGSVDFDLVVTGISGYEAHPIEWTAFGGTIITGQGTRHVRATREKGSNLTVKAEMLGLAPGCDHSASETSFAPLAVPASTLVKTESDWSLKGIDPLVAELGKDPSSMGFVVLDILPSDTVARVKSSIQKGFAKLAKDHQLKIERLRFLIGRGIQRSAKFYIVPAGSSPPTCAAASDICISFAGKP